MEHAKVGIFEDDKNWRELVAEILGDNGHSIIVTASTMEEARTVIDGLEEGDLDVAVVDGNLNPNTSSGADGAEVTRLLKAKLGSVTVIGFSGSNNVAGVDHNVDKLGDPDREMPLIIDNI